MARPLHAALVLAAASAALVGCSTTGTTSSAAPGTTASPSPGSTASASTASPATASTATAPTSGSSRSTATDPGGAVPSPPGGGRIYSEPADKISAEIGDEFVISLPAPTKSSAWVWADNCVNVKLLDQKVDSKERTLFRFQFVVSGGCYLDFYDAETADLTAEPDRRFDVSEPDL